jgi:hypothetical protein
MKKSEAQKKLQEIEAQYEVDNRASNINRARSIFAGTSFGGVTEIMMRGDGNRHLWCVMQPVEVVEFIRQLAANVGCDVDLKPRRDFASWRDWRVTEEEKQHLNGHAPFVNDMAPYNQLGASGVDKETLEAIDKPRVSEFGGGEGGFSYATPDNPLGQDAKASRGIYTQEQFDEIVATEKAKLKRKPKRTPTSS